MGTKITRVEVESPAAQLERAPDAVRCEAVLDLQAFGIARARCDHAKGHEGMHQYVSQAGAVVSFSQERV